MRNAFRRRSENREHHPDGRRWTGTLAQSRTPTAPRAGGDEPWEEAGWNRTSTRGVRTERNGGSISRVFAIIYRTISVAVYSFMHNSRLDCMRRVQPCLDAWTPGRRVGPTAYSSTTRCANLPAARISAAVKRDDSGRHQVGTNRRRARGSGRKRRSARGGGNRAAREPRPITARASSTGDNAGGRRLRGSAQRGTAGRNRAGEPREQIGHGADHGDREHGRRHRDGGKRRGQAWSGVDAMIIDEAVALRSQPG